MVNCRDMWFPSSIFYMATCLTWCHATTDSTSLNIYIKSYICTWLNGLCIEKMMFFLQQNCSLKSFTDNFPLLLFALPSSLCLAYSVVQSLSLYRFPINDTLMVMNLFSFIYIFLFWNKSLLSCKVSVSQHWPRDKL
jgi:hypothetical protein